MDYFIKFLAATLLRGLRHPHFGSFGDEPAWAIIDAIVESGKEAGVHITITRESEGNVVFHLRSIEVDGEKCWEQAGVVRYLHKDKKVHVQWKDGGLSREIGKTPEAGISWSAVMAAPVTELAYPQAWEKF